MKKMEEAGVASSPAARPEPPRGTTHALTDASSTGAFRGKRLRLVFLLLLLGQSHHACSGKRLVHWHLQGGAFRKSSQRLSLNACLHEPGQKAPRGRRSASFAEDCQVAFKVDTQGGSRGITGSIVGGCNQKYGSLFPCPKNCFIAALSHAGSNCDPEPSL